MTMHSFSATVSRIVKRSKHIGVILKVGLTAAAFWFVFHGIDFQHLEVMYKKQNHLILALAGSCILFQVVLGALRWRLIMVALTQSGHAVMSRFSAFKFYYISVFFNNCLPGTVGGDVIRVWLAKSDHVPLTLSIHSVIIDRSIALLALYIMTVATLPFLGHLLGFNGILPVPMLVAALVAGFWLVVHLDRILGGLQHIAVIRWILYFANSIRLLLERPRVSLVSLVYAIISHASLCLCAVILAQSMGEHLSILQSMTLIPPVILMTTIPISIGGWGVREASVVGLLSLVGFPQAAALMLSIQIGLLSVFVNLPAGILWMLDKQRQAKDKS